jgi:F0F1-type ATP synthase alpha subunit
MLTQPQYAGLSMPHQLALLLALDEGMLDRLPVEKIPQLRAVLPEALDEQGAGLLASIKSATLDETARIALRKLLAELIMRVSTLPDTIHSREA